jgi:hypothetical protein
MDEGGERRQERYSETALSEAHYIGDIFIYPNTTCAWIRCAPQSL